MKSITVDRQVAAPATRVWQLITDLDHANGRFSRIRKVERLDGHDAFGVGTRWRETRENFGREYTQDLEVTAIEPGRSFTMETDARGAHYRSVLSVDPLTDRTSRLALRLDTQPQGVLPALVAILFTSILAVVTRRDLRRDLDDITAAMERTGTA